MCFSETVLTTTADDDLYNQHAALVGRSIKQTQEIRSPVRSDPQKQPPSLKAELGEGCYRFPDCVELDNTQAASCAAGYTKVGWDDAGCGTKKCVSMNIAPSSKIAHSVYAKD